MNITQESVAEHLANYPWQVHITTRIPRTIPRNDAHKLFVRDILRPLQKQLKTQIASISIVADNKREGVHIHTLALANNVDLYLLIPEIQAIIDKKLADFKERKKRNPDLAPEIINHRFAVAVTPYIKEEQPRYIVEHYTGTAELERYNLRLLERSFNQC